MRRASVITTAVRLSKLWINSRSEITVGNSSPPYLALPRSPRNF